MRRPGLAASLAAVLPLFPGPVARATDASPASGADPVEAVAAPIAATPDSPALAALQVIQSLIDAGIEPAVAIEQVARLTDEDLAVLAGNPAMVQVAGSNAALTTNLIVGILVLGAIIGLAAASDGGGAVVTN